MSVESVICQDLNNRREVLLVKRTDDCKVAPSVWNVPAWKVNMLETSSEAVVRETKEETNIRVKVIKLLTESAFEIKVHNQSAYRNMFTYLTKQVDPSESVKIDHEHSTFKWVTKEEIESDKEYSSLMPRLKLLILEGLAYAK